MNVSLLNSSRGFDDQVDLTDEEFRAFQELIHTRSGIHLSDNKRSLMRAKLAKRLRALHISGFSDYYRFVAHDRSGEELIQLLDVVSINVTNFFREPGHFDYLGRSLLPALIGGSSLHPHIWSAACATGEEPCTIAMTVLEKWPQAAKRGFKILATDISTAALEKARAGEYGADRVAHVPPAMLDRYFEVLFRGGRRIYRIREEVRSLIRYRRFNLNGPHWPFQKPFDAIFCRNVMIYFNQQTQLKLVQGFTRQLRRGGILFVGHSESLVGIKHELEFVEPTVYRRTI